MPSLLELQQGFVQAIFQKSPEVLANIIPANGMTAEGGLGIYRNNVFVNAHNALCDTYPVIRRLVGDDFFRQLSEKFAHAYPSERGDLNLYGAALTHFLQNHPPVSHLPYLADIAALEWAWNEAFHAADAQALAFSRFSTVAPEDLSELRFTLHPSARFIASDYPILSIWHSNQLNFSGDGTIHLDAGSDHLLIARRGGEIVIEKLATCEFSLFVALQAQRPLGEALEAAIDINPQFDFTRFLHHRIADATLIDFSITPGDKK